MVPSGVATVIRVYTPVASFAVGRQVIARVLFTPTDDVMCLRGGGLL